MKPCPDPRTYFSPFCCCCPGLSCLISGMNETIALYWSLHFHLPHHLVLKAAARVSLLKQKSHQATTPWLKTLQWLPISFSMHTKFLRPDPECGLHSPAPLRLQSPLPLLSSLFMHACHPHVFAVPPICQCVST